MEAREMDQPLLKNSSNIGNSNNSSTSNAESGLIRLGSDSFDGSESEHQLTHTSIVAVDQSDVEEGQLSVAKVFNSNNDNNSSRRERCIKGLKYAFIFAVVFVAAAVGVCYHMGMFDKIDRDIEIDGHGNAIEPNTKIKLPLEIYSEVAIPGSNGGKKKVKQHLVGMLLRVQNFIGLNFKAFVLGYYVQTDIAKKLLLPWKNKKVSESEIDPDLVKIMADGKTIPGTLRRVMTMTMPGSSMRDNWVKQLQGVMDREHFDHEQENDVINVFKQWLSRSIHNHDRFDFSWGFTHEQTGFDASEKEQDITGVMEFVYNDQVIPPLDKSNQMIHVVLQNEFEENKGLLVNLLPHLWDN